MLNALIRELHRAQKIAVITVMLSILASAVYAGPEGGEVVGGQGAISNSGAETLINQSSQRLAVEWQSFNVGAGETVRFVQPSATAAVLNLIHDQNPSQIFGAIEANGRVFLANPNGLVFGQSATVNVGSLVAAGMSINEKSFMDDNLSFDGMGDGRVVNYGILQAANGGSINLLGSSVDNQGLIIANYGSVNLISGDKILVDFDGDGLIQFQVDKDVIDNAAGVESSVNNSGEIRADAGQVLLNANVAKDIFSRAVNNDGLISAQRIDNSGGVIRLTGNDTVIHSGDITVAGKDQNDTGGRVEILGYNTGLFENASINASGDTGGGEILIGGDYQGNNPNIQNAEYTFVSADSKIEANANVSGDGGKVIVWADKTTRYYGETCAKGGEVAGNGGFVEISGKNVLAFAGPVDTSAEQGETGMLLLDPKYITITDNNSGEASDEALVMDYGKINFTDDTGGNNTSIIGAQVLENLETTNITLNATHSITIKNLADDELTLNQNGTVKFQTGSGGFKMNLSDTINVTGTAGLTINTLGSTYHTGANGDGEISVGALKSTSGNIVLKGSVVNLHGDLTTKGGDVTVGQNVTLNDHVAVNTSGGKVTFPGKLDSDAGNNRDLTIKAGTGDVVFQGQVGGANRLGDVQIISAKDVILEMQSSFSAKSFTQYAGSGMTSIESPGPKDPPSLLNTTEDVLIVSEKILYGPSGISKHYVKGNLTLTSNGNIILGYFKVHGDFEAKGKNMVQRPGGIIVEGNTILNGTGSSITMTSASNRFNGFDKVTEITNTGGDTTINSTSLRLSHVKTQGSLTISDSNNLTLLGDINTNGEKLDLRATGALVQNANATVSAGDITLVAKAFILNGASNSIRGGGTIVLEEPNGSFRFGPGHTISQVSLETLSANLIEMTGPAGFFSDTSLSSRASLSLIFPGQTVFLENSVATAGNLSMNGEMMIYHDLVARGGGSGTINMTGPLSFSGGGYLDAGTIRLIAPEKTAIIVTRPGSGNVDLPDDTDYIWFGSSHFNQFGSADGSRKADVVEVYSDTLVYLGGSVNYTFREGIKLVSDKDIYIGGMKWKDGGSFYDNQGYTSGAEGVITGTNLVAEAAEDIYLFDYSKIVMSGLFKLEASPINDGAIKTSNPFLKTGTDPLIFSGIEAGGISLTSKMPITIEGPLNLVVGGAGSIDFSGIDVIRGAMGNITPSLSLTTAGGDILLSNVGEPDAGLNSVKVDTQGAGSLILNGSIYAGDKKDGTAANSFIDFSNVAEIELAATPIVISSDGNLFVPDVIGANIGVKKSLALSGAYISLANVSDLDSFTATNTEDSTPAKIAVGSIFQANSIITAGAFESDGDIIFDADSTTLSGSLASKSLIDFTLAAKVADINIGGSGLILRAPDVFFSGDLTNGVTGFMLGDSANLDFSNVANLTLTTDLNITVNGGDIDLGNTVFVDKTNFNGIALNITEGNNNTQNQRGNIVFGAISNTVKTMSVNSKNNIHLLGDISTPGALELVSAGGKVHINEAAPTTLNSLKTSLGGKYSSNSYPLHLTNSGNPAEIFTGSALDFSEITVIAEHGLALNSEVFEATLGDVQAANLTILNSAILSGNVDTSETNGFVLADNGALSLDKSVLLDTFTNASDGIGGTVHFGANSTVNTQDNDFTILSGLGIHMESTATVAKAAVPSGNIDWTTMLGNIDLGQIDAAGSDVNLAANGGFITSEYMPIDQLDVTMLVNNIIGDSITLLGSLGVGAKVLGPVVIHANKQININVGSGYGFVVNTNKVPIVVSGSGEVFDVVASRYLTAETAERSAAQSIYTDFYLDHLFEGNAVNVDEYSIDYLMAQYQTDGEYSLSSLEPDVPTMLRTATGWKLSRTNRAVRQPEIGNEQIPRRHRTKNSVKSERIEWINRGFKYQIPNSEVQNKAP